MQRVVYNDSINISPGATSAIKLNHQSDSNLRNVISSSSEAIRASIQSRNRAFGNTELSRIDPNLMNIVTGSFPGVLELDGINKFKKDVNQFDSSGGIDTTGYVNRDGSILFVLVENHAPIPSIGLFESKLAQSLTLYRIPIRLTNNKATSSQIQTN